MPHHEQNPDPFFYETEFFRKTGGENDKCYQFEGFSYGGNTDPETGSALPYFSKEVADDLVGDLAASGINLFYDETSDAYTCADKKGELHIFKGEDIEAQDTEPMGGTYKEHVYPIGQGIKDGTFAWEEIVKSWNYVTRAICPYCGTEFGEVNNTCEECGRTVYF